MKIVYLLILLPFSFWTLFNTSFDSNVQTDRQEWILNLHPDANIEELILEFSQEGIHFKYLRRVARNMNLHLVEYTGRLSEDQLVDAVFKSNKIKNISYNTEVDFRETRPDDLFYGSNQANMETIGMPKVWDVTTGGVTPNGDVIVVAVIDGAFQIDHPDLIDNLWTFSSEVAGDGIDNDGNGYIDDVHGWNSFDANPITSVQDDHGTGVAGIVGARGNNSIGVTGVNWTVGILPVAIRPASFGGASVASILGAYDYVLTQRKLYNETNGATGAYVVATNSSFGVGNSSEMANAAWCEFYNMMGDEGILNVAGATNTNVDVADDGDIPSLCSSDDLLVVNNVNLQDVFVGSGFSTTMVDLAAPGEGVFTMTDDDGYAELGGTSSAAPHVAGTIGLLYSLPCSNLGDIMRNNPQEYMNMVKQAILDGVDPLLSLTDKNITGGRINVSTAADILMAECVIISATEPTLSSTHCGIKNIYPMPVKQDLTIEYQNNYNRDPATFHLYNTGGQLIRTFTSDPIVIGLNTFKIDDLGVSAGTYYLRFACEGRELAHPVVVH